MLINKNCLDKRNSKYECDMCGIGLKSKDRFIFYIAEGYKSATKKWDLCSKCYKKMSKAIKKYRIKTNETAHH